VVLKLLVFCLSVAFINCLIWFLISLLTLILLSNAGGFRLSLFSDSELGMIGKASGIYVYRLAGKRTVFCGLCRRGYRWRSVEPLVEPQPTASLHCQYKRWHSPPYCVPSFLAKPIVKAKRNASFFFFFFFFKSGMLKLF